MDGPSRSILQNAAHSLCSKTRQTHTFLLIDATMHALAVITVFLGLFVSSMAAPTPDLDEEVSLVQIHPNGTVTPVVEPYVLLKNKKVT